MRNLVTFLALIQWEYWPHFDRDYDILKEQKQSELRRERLKRLKDPCPYCKFNLKSGEDKCDECGKEFYKPEDFAEKTKEKTGVLENVKHVRTFSLLSLCCGIIFLIYPVIYTINSVQRSNWPHTNGDIMLSKITTSENGSILYGADIIFKYKVGFIQYRSDKVSFGQYKSGDISYAKEIVEKYAEGSKVKVFYDPNRPEVAVLEPGFQLHVPFVFSILGGVVFLCLGVPFIKALIRCGVSADSARFGQ